jgi:hypothetical protein
MRAMSAFLALLYCSMLLGCSANDREAQNRALENIRLAEADCNSRFPLEDRKFIDNTECKNDVIRRFALPNSPHPDLLNWLMASQSALAVRVQRGDLSYEDALLQHAQMVSYITAEANNRNAAQRAREIAAWSHVSAGFAALGGNSTPQMQPMQPIQPLPRMTQTRCQRFGQTINCTTY